MVITMRANITGIYDDVSKQGYNVKKNGLKRKTFYYRQVSKESAYKKACRYATVGEEQNVVTR